MTIRVSASTPDRLLRGQLACEVQRLLQSPDRNQSNEYFGTNVEHELSIFKICLEKLLPMVRHFLRRYELAIERHHLNPAAHGHDVAVDRIHHLYGDLQYLLLGHPQNVKLFQVGEILFVVIVLQVVDIDALGQSGVELLELPYINLGAPCALGAGI